MKIVVNRCFGGFGLSKDALRSIEASHPELLESHISTNDGLGGAKGEKVLTLGSGSVSELQSSTFPKTRIALCIGGQLEWVSL